MKHCHVNTTSDMGDIQMCTIGVPLGTGLGNIGFRVYSITFSLPWSFKIGYREIVVFLTKFMSCIMAILLKHWVLFFYRLAPFTSIIIMLVHWAWCIEPIPLKHLSLLTAIQNDWVLSKFLIGIWKMLVHIEIFDFWSHT